MRRRVRGEEKRKGIKGRRIEDKNEKTRSRN